MTFEQAAPRSFVLLIGAALFVLPFAIIVLARDDPEYTPLLAAARAIGGPSDA